MAAQKEEAVLDASIVSSLASLRQSRVATGLEMLELHGWTARACEAVMGQLLSGAKAAQVTWSTLWPGHGLTTVMEKILVDDMRKGDFEVDWTPGQGATITLRTVAVPAAAKPLPSPAPSAPVAKPMAAPASTPTADKPIPAAPPTPAPALVPTTTPLLANVVVIDPPPPVAAAKPVKPAKPLKPCRASGCSNMANARAGYCWHCYLLVQKEKKGPRVRNNAKKKETKATPAKTPALFPECKRCGKEAIYPPDEPVFCADEFCPWHTEDEPLRLNEKGHHMCTDCYEMREARKKNLEKKLKKRTRVDTSSTDEAATAKKPRVGVDPSDVFS